MGHNVLQNTPLNLSTATTPGPFLPPLWSLRAAISERQLLLLDHSGTITQCATSQGRINVLSELCRHLVPKSLYQNLWTSYHLHRLGQLTMSTNHF